VTFATAGTYTITFTVRDSLGLADPTPPTRVITVNSGSGGGTNLVGNPSFETNTNGWNPYGGDTIARVPGGFDGSWCVEMT
jgi:hypothetical protein